MALQTQTRRNRSDSPARWMKAAERAIDEGVQVRQLQGTGQWVATSGSDAAVAYEVQVAGNVAYGCDCLAGLNNDPVCKHRAAFYLLIGSIELTPEPEPPAPAPSVNCPDCCGCGVQWFPSGDRKCERCRGTGILAPAVIPFRPRRPAAA